MIVKSTSLQYEDENMIITFSSIIDENGNYIMPSLSLFFKDGGETDYLDNEEWLSDLFIDLKSKDDDETEKKYGDIFPRYTFDVLCEILDEAYNMKLFFPSSEK